jgi:DNA-binding NarL/FixJ family response regulator
MNDIKVAIFEDNKLVRDALEAILNGTTGFSCTGAFSSGNNWQTDITKSNPQVILMDIEMPGPDGITLTKQITAKYPEIKILIQTVFDDNEKIFQALCAGAAGYILKNDSPHKYLEAVTEVFDGKASINASIAKKVIGFFANKNVVMAAPSGEDYRLSIREQEILKHIVTGKSLKEIAADLFISYDTIRTHSKHIYKKLQVASRSEASIKAIQQGLV